jgi:hypothetical protein
MSGQTPEATKRYRETLDKDARAKYMKEYRIKRGAGLLEKKRQYYRRIKETRYELLIYKSAKSRAKEKGLEFDIEVSDIIIPEFCPILGIPLISSDKITPNTPSIDRRDPTKGYIKGNIAVISQKANRKKSNLTIEETKALLRYMEGN